MGVRMIEEITNLLNLQVYTPNGVLLGEIDNIIVDVANNKIDGVFITGTNPELIQDAANISVPYRWVQCVGDIVILKYFPPKVTIKKGEGRKEED